MRILSLNAWGGALRDELVAFLADVDADVVCLQEVPRALDARSEWLKYRDGAVEIPQRADLFADVRAALPLHDGRYYPAMRGQLVDGDTPCSQEFGLATFVRSSLAVTAEAMAFVHGAYAADGFGPHPRPRNAHAVRLVDHGTGRPVTVVQLHGLREESGKGDTPARAAQAEALVGLIHRVRPAGEPLVVCGDLNVLPDSGLLATLSAVGLTELVTSRGFTDTRTSHYAKPGRFADYLLVSPEVDVVDFDVVAEPEVSDHRPLLLTTA